MATTIVPTSVTFAYRHFKHFDDAMSQPLNEKFDGFVENMAQKDWNVSGISSNECISFILQYFYCVLKEEHLGTIFWILVGNAQKHVSYWAFSSWVYLYRVKIEQLWS